MKKISLEQMMRLLNNGYLMDISDFEFAYLSRQQKHYIIKTFINDCLANMALTLAEDPDTIAYCIEKINSYASALYQIKEYLDCYYPEKLQGDKKWMS